MQLRLRRGVSIDWRNANPVLEAGEPGFEINTGRFKIGDGRTHWLDLEYFAPAAASGGVGGSSYLHIQATPAATWPIDHDLGRYPTVSVLVDGALVLTDVEYSNLDQVSITFAVPTSGLAVLA